MLRPGVNDAGESVAEGTLVLWLRELRAGALGEDAQALWLRAHFAGRAWTCGRAHARWPGSRNS